MEYCYPGTENLLYGIELVTFVMNWIVKLTILPDRSRSVTFCRVCDLQFNMIYLAKVIVKFWVVYGQNIFDDIVMFVALNWEAYFLFPTESKDKHVKKHAPSKKRNQQNKTKKKKTIRSHTGHSMAFRKKIRILPTSGDCHVVLIIIPHRKVMVH